MMYGKPIKINSQRMLDDSKHKNISLKIEYLLNSK
jgi:hypothetical protein